MKLCLCGCGQPVNKEKYDYLFNHHQSHSITCSKCGGVRKAKYAGGLCETCHDREVIANAPKVLCKCGCGELIPSITKDGKPRLYKLGHHIKGKRNVNWNGGVRNDDDGYRYILKPEHPFCDYAGYVPEHRLIMEYYYSIIFDEQIFIPYPEFEVHHIKPVTKDFCDNSLMNLELVTHKEHGIIHKDLHIVDTSGRFCCDPDCKDRNKIYTDKRTGRPLWRKNTFSWIEGEFLHSKCFYRNCNKNKKK